MNISEIKDDKLRALAEKRREERITLWMYNNSVYHAFDWGKTPEGIEFWSMVNNGTISTMEQANDFLGHNEIVESKGPMEGVSIPIIDNIGISLREYYAGLAMKGMAAQDVSIGDIARNSVEMADMLIEELNKDKN